MTKRSDLKTIIRNRMKKTGESYAVARRHVLAEGGHLCPACKGELRVEIRQHFAEADEDATDGQLADRDAAESSGDWGEWGYSVRETYCEKCEPEMATLARALFTRPQRRLR